MAHDLAFECAAEVIPLTGAAFPGDDMRFFAGTSLLLIALSLFLTAPLQGAAAGRVLRLADRQGISFSKMVDEISPARYLFLAENHTDSWHHAAQLDIIRALKKSGRPLAIGLEMFTSSSQNKLDLWNSGGLSVEELRQVYIRDWNVPWDLYRDIFLYARDNRIPLVGLNLPKAISSKVASRGFASLTPEERSQLPPGITCNVSPAYMAFIRQAYSSHGMDGREFTNFCEAQLLWNRHMARQLQSYAAGNPNQTLLVLVGIGHALRQGVPAETTGDTNSYRVILPEFAGLNRTNLTKNDADYLILAPE